ncbi:MAG TPA: hypothetical protein VFR28_08845 [Allosphingosinicella sp.]|jgi:hypothetical protein|nr:hypothetical protein [Allosphingosinicella sp.]
MPWVQAETGLGVVPQVQIDNLGTMMPVAIVPHVTPVNLPFLQLQNPNRLINNPRDDVVYQITEDNDGNLIIDTVPLVLGAGSATGSEEVARQAAPSQKSRASSIARSGVTGGLLITAGLLYLHGLHAGSDGA